MRRDYQNVSFIWQMPKEPFTSAVGLISNIYDALTFNFKTTFRFVFAW